MSSLVLLMDKYNFFCKDVLDSVSQYRLFDVYSRRKNLLNIYTKTRKLPFKR